MRLEAIAFRVAPGPLRLPLARRVVAAVLDERKWTVSPLALSKGEFEAVPRGRARSPSARAVASAWQLVHALRADPRVLWAEPLFAVLNADEDTARFAADEVHPATDDFEWSLDAMRVKEAWTLFEKKTPGDGAFVFHPDTGYTDHPEIVSSRLLASAGYNFEEGNPDAHDTLAAGLPSRTPGHGTETSSVIMSAAGGPDLGVTPFVSGTAPGASLVPLRTTKSTVLFSHKSLISAIRYAIDSVEPKCDVLSISLGVVSKSPALHSAVQDAAAAGIIVLCGAGNSGLFGSSVKYPAAYDEAIAVAASEVHDVAWHGSCRGSAIDITAPGAAVWSARTRKNGRDRREGRRLGRDHLVFDVSRDSGTSFACAGTAGVAALWISFHGRQTLVDKYGASGIPAVFKQLLQENCTKPGGWDTHNYGPGIVNAFDLLKAPLPDAPGMSLRADGRKPASIDEDVLEQIVHLAFPAPRSGVALLMAGVLRVPESMLTAALHRVGHEIVFNVAHDRRLRTSLRASAEAVMLQPDARTARRARARWATSLRRRLSGRAASPQLRQALAAGRR